MNEKTKSELASDEPQDVGESENAVYPVGCLLCGETKDILIFPHRVNKIVVGLIYVCNPHASTAGNGYLRVQFQDTPFQENLIKVGDLVEVGEQENPRHNVMYAGYKGIVTDIRAGLAFVETDKTKQRQSVSFRQWFPLETLIQLNP